MNKYYFCELVGESVNYILLHCTKVRILWQLLFPLFNVVWVIPSSVKDTLLSWNDSFVGKKSKKVWRASVESCSSSPFLDNLSGMKSKSF